MTRELRDALVVGQADVAERGEKPLQGGGLLLRQGLTPTFHDAELNDRIEVGEIVGETQRPGAAFEVRVEPFHGVAELSVRGRKPLQEFLERHAGTCELTVVQLGQTA